MKQYMRIHLEKLVLKGGALMVRIKDFAGMVLLLLVVIFAFSACSKQPAEKVGKRPRVRLR
jgi:hypothetical protein